MDEIFTPANDVEHSFANPEHLKAVFGDLPAEIVEATVRDAVQEKRDVLVLAVQKARDQIAGSLYESERKKGKPEWAAAGLAQDAQDEGLSASGRQRSIPASQLPRQEAYAGCEVEDAPSGGRLDPGGECENSIGRPQPNKRSLAGGLL